MSAAKQRNRPVKGRKIRVFLVDDHPVVRQGFVYRLNLESDLEVCGEAATAAEAMSKIDALQPDVALVDLSLEEGNGLDLLKDLKSRGDKLKILVVSSSEESMYAERSIRAGAQGFLHKSEAVDKIVEAIHRVMGGGLFLSEEIAARVLDRALMGQAQPTASPLDSLSDRELQVYESLGKGQSVNEIAEKLFLSPKTIETYRENLKKKLNLKKGSDLIRHAIQWTLERA